MKSAMNWQPSTNRLLVTLASVFMAWPMTATAFSNDAFECYGAVYSNLNQPPTLVNPAMRVGLHPQGRDPVIHLYGDSLAVLPLKSVKISDRFMRGRIHSPSLPSIDLGRLLLRQKGLELTFGIAQAPRGASQTAYDLSFVGECSSVGYRPE